MGRTLRKVKVKYSGFGFGSSRVNLKVREAASVPRDPTVTCPGLFKGACSPSVLARPCLSYCMLWPYLVRWYLVFCYACGVTLAGTALYICLRYAGLSLFIIRWTKV